MSTATATVEPRAGIMRGEGVDPVHGAREEGPRRPSTRHPIKDAVLTLAGLCGLLCLLWVGASLAFGVSIVVFTTGSMAPTMPTGSAALVRPVAAADLSVGDVVTVQREGTRLPITHRIVSISRERGAGPDAGRDATSARLLVLRGDANDVNDPFPYRVTQAQLVVAAVPGLGSLIVAARTPLATAAMTLVVAALVAWAFWPSREPSHRAERRSP
jgi:signal peptidase